MRCRMVIKLFSRLVCSFVMLMSSAGLALAATPDGVLSDSIAERVISAWGDQPAGIIVHVKEGVVEMWGEAPSESAVAEADDIAKNTVGVRQVINHLQVGSNSTDRATQQQAGLQSSTVR